MSSTLKSLGFVRAKRANSVVFTYPNGGPVILLPAYKSGEAVKPIHRLMVERQLTDAGIVKPRGLPTVGHVKAAPKSKPANKAKAPVK